jgi:hypothetical protein
MILARARARVNVDVRTLAIADTCAPRAREDLQTDCQERGGTEPVSRFAGQFQSNLSVN